MRTINPTFTTTTARTFFFSYFLSSAMCFLVVLSSAIDLSAQEAKPESKPRRRKPNEEQRQRVEKLRQTAGIIGMQLESQSPTVLYLLSTSFVFELELSDSQVAEIVEYTSEIKDLIKEELNRDVRDLTNAAQAQSAILHVRVKHDGELPRELKSALKDLRTNIHDILLPHQLDQLMGATIVTRGYMSIFFEEVAKELDIKDSDLQELGDFIKNERQRIQREVGPKYPSKEDREALRAAGAREIGAHYGPGGREAYVQARAQMEVDVYKRYEEVLSKEKVERIRSLVKTYTEKFK